MGIVEWVQAFNGKATCQVFFVQKHLLSSSATKSYPKTFILFLYQGPPWSLPLQTLVFLGGTASWWKSLLEIWIRLWESYPPAWWAHNLTPRDKERKCRVRMRLCCEVSLLSTLEDGSQNISSLVLKVWHPRSMASVLLQSLVEMEILRPYLTNTEWEILELGPNNMFQQAFQVILIHADV